MHLAFNVAVTLAVMLLETQIAILAGLYFVLAVMPIAGLDTLLQQSEEVTEEV
jgi:hypothetical protein